MKLRIFQSGKGDCLLLTGDDGKRILIDGGLKGPYREHVGPWLDRHLRRKGKDLDVVYVSHIDADHIEGVLELLDNLVAWRVFDHQRANGNDHIEEPESKRPPEPLEIWHNAFHEQLGPNSGAIADMYAAVATVLGAHADEEIREFALRREDLATSKRQAVLVSRRVGPKQLDIPLNKPAKGKLMFAHDGQRPFKVGGMSVSVVGPFEADLKKLRKDWNAWLRKNRKLLRDIARDSRRDERDLTASSLLQMGVFPPSLAQALGQRENVTTPNLASLMLYIEEDGSSVLLTGDGHEDDILKGLRAAGKLDAEGGLHVDVLKVQHHGSEHNLDPARKPRTFPQIITADNYVFCGNGAHHNPDLRIVEAFLKSRLGSKAKRSKNPEVGRQFKFWFSSSPSSAGKASYEEHMRKVRKLVRRYQQRSKGKLRYDFLEGSSVEFKV